MGKSLKERKYFLVDNGSLGPEAVLNLRTIAHSLAKITDCEVRPMGLMHSHKVEPSALDGLPGESMEAFLQSDEAGSMDQIRVLPFFSGRVWRSPIGCRETSRSGDRKRRAEDLPSWIFCLLRRMTGWPASLRIFA